jgi:TolA-binding protein
MATYFRETGSRAYEKDLYLMMGNQYIAAGQPQQAIGTYHTFVQQHPQHAMAPIFASYVMEVYERQKDAEATQRARILLVNTYASGSVWYQANDDAARARSRPLVKESLHRLALSAHTKAQVDKRPEDYRQAVEWYRAFITEFPREKETPEVHFFLAESLLALQEYALAAAAYEASAYGYPEKGIDRKAAYAAVTTYEKVQTPAGQQQFLVLAQRFADHFPEDSQTPAILLKSGELLFDKQRYAEARGVLEGLLVHYPAFTASPIAQKLVAHSYMQQGQYDEARKAYGRTLALLPASEKTQRREASDLMAAAMYKQGEQHKKENRLDAAARAFQDIVKEAPDSDLASAALFEAGALYETLKRSSEAISTYHALIERDPNSALAAKATLQMGFLYEQDKQWLQAAEAFETAARSIPDRELATQILWTAGLHYEKVSQWAKSYAVFATFTQQFPKHPDVPEGLLKMAQARQKQGKGKEALDLFAKIEREAPGTPQAAQAVFQRAEEAFKGLKQIALKEPFKKQFKKKTQALETTVTLYTRAAESRFADVVATSAHRLGEVFEHFKTALLDAELPKKLTKEQAEEYRFQLEEKAFPFEEKAIQAYSSNVQRAQSQPGLYNEWVRKSYDRLAELRPSLYKRPERAERITSNIDPQNLSASNPQSMTREVLRAER